MFYIKNSLLFLLCLLSIGIHAQTTTVSGNIATPAAEPMANLEVTITAENFSATTTTNIEGNYSLENVPSGATIQISVVKEDADLNGVSTFDYVLTARHILGITPFDTPDKYIAMDINNSASRNITAFDLVQMRQLILGITEEFPNNDAWRFVEKAQLAALNFSQANDPEYEGNLTPTFSLSAGENTVIDFIGIKIGDANGNAAAN